MSTQELIGMVDFIDSAISNINEKERVYVPYEVASIPKYFIELIDSFENAKHSIKKVLGEYYINDYKRNNTLQQ